jgi:hypothetical protein
MRFVAWAAVALGASCAGEQLDGDGGEGDGDLCETQSDGVAFGFSVKDRNGAGPAPAHVGGTFRLRGIVRSVGSTSFSVEGCGIADGADMAEGGAGGVGGESGGASGSPGDCEPELWTIEASLPERTVPVETAMQVNLTYASWCQPYSGCNQTMIVRDELADGEPTLLAMYRASFGARTGPVTNPFEWPVTLELVDLGCFPPNVDAQPRGPTRWALRMTGRANPASSVLLRGGDSAELALEVDSGDRWLAYNKDTSDLGGYDATSSLHFSLSKRPASE